MDHVGPHQLPDAKILKKLADACRKAGIKTFKGYGIEFTLADEAPVKKPRGRAAMQQSNPAPQGTMDADPAQGSIESDELTPEQLLMWSAAPSEFGLGEESA